MAQNGINPLGVNLTFTKFVFISPSEDDDAARTRLRNVGALVARGFFNDFDAQSAHDTGPHETIQFFVAANPRGLEGLAGARYVVQMCSKYRPRLADAELELRRRLGEQAQLVALDGATRVPHYTSAEMYAYAFKPAMIRTTGRLAPNAIIVPLRKTLEWWAMTPLERQTYFYPHIHPVTHQPAKGHALAAEAGIRHVYRRVYHDPDGHSLEGHYDFISYFECADEHLSTFDHIRHNLRDERQNPEWRYVIEGPEWRGHRVLRW